MDVYQHVKISYLIRFHQNENLLRFSRRRRLDDVFTTSHMRRTLARENFFFRPSSSCHFVVDA